MIIIKRKLGKEISVQGQEGKCRNWTGIRESYQSHLDWVGMGVFDLNEGKKMVEGGNGKRELGLAFAIDANFDG